MKSSLDQQSDEQYSQTIMLHFIDKYFSFVTIAVLLVYINQRKYERTHVKKQALVWMVVLMCLFQVSVSTTILLEWPVVVAWLSLAILISVALIFRRRVFPFKLHCPSCRKKLDWEHIIGHDDCLCEACWEKAHPEEARKNKEERPAFVMPSCVEEMDWDNWEPTDICVITYLIEGDKVLLIDKKQGLGTGYINAPGGHIEPTEMAEEAARRECKEETGLTIKNLSLRGELFFQFKDGMAEHAYVYVANGYEGTLSECEETRPFWWADRFHLPFERMWADDPLWVPQIMESKSIKGYFLFDGKQMIDSKVETIAKAE